MTQNLLFRLRIQHISHALQFLGTDNHTGHNALIVSNAAFVPTGLPHEPRLAGVILCRYMYTHTQVPMAAGHETTAQHLQQPCNSLSG